MELPREPPPRPRPPARRLRARHRGARGVEVARRRGPSGADSLAWEDWLLNFKRQSQELREEVAKWVEWLSNRSPPWAAIRALMTNRLVALDKQPGVRPVGIGEVLRRLIAKCVLVECADDAKAACGSTNLCAGLEAGIEGALHAVDARARERRALCFDEEEASARAAEEAEARRLRQAFLSRNAAASAAAAETAAEAVSATAWSHSGSAQAATDVAPTSQSSTRSAVKSAD